MKMNLFAPLKLSLVMLILATVARISSAQPAKPVAEVPFEFTHNQILVQVNVGGKGPFNMLLDTDTDPSAIDTATARELGLQVSAKGSPATGGGTDTNLVYPTKLPSVEVGKVTAKDVLAATIDLTKLATRLGKPIHGVLGYSFLKDRIVQIDYQNSVLRFYNDTPFPGVLLSANTVSRIAVSFRREDGDVIIDSVFVNGEKMKATLDTGSSGRFSLTPEAVAALGLEESARDVEGDDSVGYNGSYKTKMGMLKSIRLGRFVQESVSATFWLPDTRHDKKKFQVNIGNDFFKDFVMTFDFKNKIVVFDSVE